MAVIALLSGTAGASNLPDHDLTPGAVILGVTAEQVCRPGWAASRRHVTKATKRLVFRRYQIAYEPKKYEVDHLISLQLGGSNDIKNLWPEPYEPKPGALEKDRIEGELHRRVCRHDITLEEAQKTISADWVSFYQQWATENQ